MEQINDVLQIVVDACEERKAGNIVALDMTDLTPMADYFLICHGNNERQVQAIARSVKAALEEREERIIRMEGFNSARWILIDLGHIICHIFHKDERHYYNLERLWGDASEISVRSLNE